MTVVFGAPATPEPLLRKQFPGGTPVEWSLCSPDAALQAARVTGGATFLQTEHVVTSTAARARGDEHRSVVGAVARFDTTLDPVAMAAALTAFVQRHDELRSFYTLGEVGVERRVIPQTHVEMVAQWPLGRDQKVDAEDAGDYLANRISVATAFDSPQSMHFGAFDGDGGFTFYLGADHVHGDGYSLWLAMDEINALYRAETTGTSATLTDVASFGNYVADEHRRAARVRADDIGVKAWREALAIKGSLPASPVPLGLDDDAPVPAVRCRRDLLTADEADALDVVSASSSWVTIAGCLFSALASAQYICTGEKRFFTTTALATRGIEFEFTQGWACNFAPVYFDIDPGADPIELARTASVAVKRAKGAAAAPIGAVLQVLARSGELPQMAGSPQMVTYIDHRRLPGIDDPTVGTTVGFPGIGKTKNSNLWLSRMVDGLVVESQIPDNDVARAHIERYLDTVAAQLRALLESADFAVTAIAGTRVRQ
ncbi:condensation domain-containing protein [Gordonia sputi]